MSLCAWTYGKKYAMYSWPLILLNWFVDLPLSIYENHACWVMCDSVCMADAFCFSPCIIALRCVCVCLCVCLFVCLSARSVGNELSRMTQIISTNIHKLTQNGNSFINVHETVFNVVHFLSVQISKYVLWLSNDLYFDYFCSYLWR